MAPPKLPTRERVERLSHRDGIHLIWDGQLKRHHPFLKGVGNPVRVLLNLEDQPHIRVKPTCLDPRCIEPTHWRVIKTRSRWYDDRPPPRWRDPRLKSDEFSDRDLEEIEETAAEIIAGDMTIETLHEFMDDGPLKEEILSRVNRLRSEG